MATASDANNSPVRAPVPFQALPLVFMHLPKCGGTSLHELLCLHFPKKRVCPDRFNVLLTRDPRWLQDFRLISGHFDRANIEHVPDPKRVICLLREPRARVLSVYRFWRAHREDRTDSAQVAQCVRLAKTRSLVEFLRCRSNAIPENIDNFMVRSLAGPLYVGTQGEFLFPPQETLRRATDFLERMECFGMLEQFDSFLRVLSARLGMPMPRLAPHRVDHMRFSNSKGLQRIDDPAVTPDVAHELDRLTYLDRELYAWACQRFEAKFLGGPLPPPLPLPWHIRARHWALRVRLWASGTA